MNNLIRTCFSAKAAGAALVLLCCSCSDEVMHDEYYLPCGYVGWVNLIYEHPGTSRVFYTADTIRYLLAGDLVNCYIGMIPKAGSFTDSFYYYCPTGIQRLRSHIRYKTYVPVKYITSIRLAGKTHSVQAFYVASHPMNRALPDDSIPPNPLQNFVPATIMPPERSPQRIRHRP